MNDSETYDSYPSEDEVPCSQYSLETMGSSDSEDYESESPVRTILLKVKDVSVEEEDVSTLVEDIISKIEGRCILYPETMEEYLSINHSKLLDDVSQERGFVYLSRSLVVTLNVENQRIKIPDKLICDVCIFTYDKPVLVLSFVTGDVKTDKQEFYNSFLTKCVTDLLRRAMRTNITVLNGVVEQNIDLPKRMEEITSSLYFAIHDSLNMNSVLCGNAVRAFLLSIAECKAIAAVHEGHKEHKLSKDEFILLTHVIEDNGIEIAERETKSDFTVALEIACRLSRSGKTSFQWSSARLQDTERKCIQRQYPNLEITTDKMLQSTGFCKYIVQERKEGHTRKGLPLKGFIKRLGLSKSMRSVSTQSYEPPEIKRRFSFRHLPFKKVENEENNTHRGAVGNSSQEDPRDWRKIEKKKPTDHALHLKTKRYFVGSEGYGSLVELKDQKEKDSVTEHFV